MREARKVASVVTEQGEEQKKGHSLEAQRDNNKVHFASLMDTCHLKKMRSWNLNFKKYKGWVVLRGDIVKDDSGSYAIFTDKVLLCLK